MIKVKIPATTANFGPGFDCIGAALGLYNYIEMRFSEEPKVLVKKGYKKNIKEDKTNLIYRVAKTTLSKFGIDRPLAITLYNNIPIARGLGSSAACIIGSIIAASRLAGKFLSIEEILYHAVKIEGHPDNIVPALIGGFCVSMVDSNKVYYKRLHLPEHLRFVIGVPRFLIKTQEARNVMPKSVCLQDAIFNLSRCALLIASIIEQDFTNLDIFCKDKLHQPYRKLLIPGIDEILSKAKCYGALASFISGAGPSVICLSTENKADNLGKFMKNVFFDMGIKSTYKILSPSNTGAEVIKIR